MLLQHRGPDFRKIVSSGNVILGHIRLSILDLDIRSHQPFEYLDRYVIVFNGEIYNYLELKEDLKNIGYSFRTESDTEVILALYDFKGRSFLSDLDGMFAFAIWDKHKNELFCARDRFGEKPFFYKSNEGEFIFASEIKAILPLSSKNSYSKKAIDFFLNNQRHINEPETFFENIFSLLPGHFLVCKQDGKFEINTYYNLYKDFDKLKGSEISYEEAVKTTKEKFIASVKLRLRSDVPIGCSLSGGIDSSIIAGVASNFTEKS
ncbi:MAG: asparagine synthase (glutamine-hydrolyzing) [Bacteroidetes bacterium]|nr:asparagine synthase (glutamine-hydrolyzing) [Bacteroidota bacterium]